MIRGLETRNSEESTSLHHGQPQQPLTPAPGRPGDPDLRGHLQHPTYHMRTQEHHFKKQKAIFLTF